MNRTIAYCLLIAGMVIIGALTISAPTILSDQNTFLKGFVSFELLNLLGVVVTITLASAAQLHLSFNRIEERFRTTDGLAKTRRSVRDGAYWLIRLFVMALVLVVVKPMMPDDAWISSALNGFAIWIVFFNVLILVELTQLVFAIEPIIDDAP